MVTKPIGIWHQIDTSTRIQNDLIWCIVMTTWPWNGRTTGRRKNDHVARKLVHQFAWHWFTTKNTEWKRTGYRCKECYGIVVAKEPTNLKNDLEDWKIEEVDGKKTIFHKGKNYILKDQELQWDVVKMYHHHKTAGHPGELEMYNSI